MSTAPADDAPTTTITPEQIDNIRNEMTFGFDPDSLSVYVGRQTDGSCEKRWNLKSNAHSGQTKRQVAIIQDHITKRARELESEEKRTGISQHVARLDLNDESAKKILELVLDDFDYAQEYESGTDTSQLQIIAAELSRFLVVDGGLGEHQRSQMLQRLAGLSRSGTTTD